MVQANPAPQPDESGLLGKCMMIFVRHGERLDQVKTKPAGHRVLYSFDPQLTPNGCNQAAQVGKKVVAFLAQQGYTQPLLTFIASPHFRTL